MNDWKFKAREKFYNVLVKKTSTAVCFIAAYILQKKTFQTN